jgi:hypothetical protein
MNHTLKQQKIKNLGKSLKNAQEKRLFANRFADLPMYAPNTKQNNKLDKNKEKDTITPQQLCLHQSIKY